MRNETSIARQNMAWICRDFEGGGWNNLPKWQIIEKHCKWYGTKVNEYQNLQILTFDVKLSTDQNYANI